MMRPTQRDQPWARPPPPPTRNCWPPMTPRPSGSSTTATRGRCSATSRAGPATRRWRPTSPPRRSPRRSSRRSATCPTGAPALAWLYAIAARRLADYQRRGAVERRMQRALAMERVPLSEEDAEMIRLLADDAALAMLAELPRDQRDAVTAHVVDDRGYPELAEALSTSEAAVRQRVSRGSGDAAPPAEEGARERLPHRAAARGRRRARRARAPVGARHAGCAPGDPRRSPAPPRPRPCSSRSCSRCARSSAPEPRASRA